MDTRNSGFSQVTVFMAEDNGIAKSFHFLFFAYRLNQSCRKEGMIFHIFIICLSIETFMPFCLPFLLFYSFYFLYSFQFQFE